MWARKKTMKQYPPAAKQGYRTVGKKTHFFRSKMEANYARYLQFLKEKGEILDWEHEPKTFWFYEIKRGIRSYLPDFRILTAQGEHFWVEVKGFMDSRSKTKLKRFKKYYPHESLTVVQKKEFMIIERQLERIIKDWE